MASAESQTIAPTTSGRPLLSVVVPSFHNAATLEVLFERIRASLEPHATQVDYEVVFVEDGSADNTWQVLVGLRDAKLNPL